MYCYDLIILFGIFLYFRSAHLLTEIGAKVTGVLSCCLKKKAVFLFVHDPSSLCIVSFDALPLTPSCEKKLFD